MIQAMMTKPGEIVFQEVEVPKVGKGQIKLKMKRIGICGSDIHVNHGKHPFTSYPVVQGHEVSAEVVEVGQDVTNVKLGDKVTVQPQVVCGKCYPCTHGMYNVCEELKVMGFQTTGMASEFFVVDAEKAVKLPDTMSWDHGSMIEPLAVAVHAIRRFGDVTGKNVLVLGGGTIGNLVAQGAKAMGASKLLLSEVSEYRLKTAKQVGINVVNPTKEVLRDKMYEYFGSGGADVIFECVGINATMDQAITYARKGSDIVVVGVFGDIAAMNAALIQDHELRLSGTAMYRVEDYEKAIELVGKGLIEFDALITDHVSFKEFMRAYEIIDEQKDKVMKVIVVIDE